MTSIVDKNVIKNIQCHLEEAGLYRSSIDGDWGKGSDSALREMVTSHKPEQVVSITNWSDNKQIIKDIQGLLGECGLYSYDPDGVWGNGSECGLTLLKEDYKTTHDLPAYSLVWSSLVSPEFVNRVINLAEENGYSYEFCQWLMACMHFETGGTFSASIQNGAGANYFGLIQFGTMAATDLGTTVDELKAMDEIEQLEWVFKYFNMWRTRGKKYVQLEDLYLTIFYPVAVGKNADTTIFLDGSTGYRQNHGFDTDKDGNITVGEICKRIYQTYFDGRLVCNRVVETNLK